MPPKRAATTSSALRKRVKVARQGTYGQPIFLKDSQQSQRLSPPGALANSRLPGDTFELQLRKAVPKRAIVAPDEASEAATVTATVEDNAEEEGFDAHLEDTFEGIDWSRLQRYMKPLASARARRSWVYRYGWRIALLKDPDRVFFVCQYCHEHRLI
jgi:hypothetical protein